MTDRAYARHAFVCTYGPWCSKETEAAAVHAKMKRAVKEAGASASDVRVNKSGCLNQCGNGPVCVVYPEAVWYANLDLAGAERVAREHLAGGRVVEELRWHPPSPGANKIPRIREAEAAEKAKGPRS